MGQFTYQAVTAEGKEKKGTIEADDINKVYAMLKKDGLVPVKVSEASILSKDINISIGSPVKPRELGVFCRQFQSILGAGVTIIEALKMLAAQSENKAFKKALDVTVSAVERGETLGNAMRLSPKVFPNILINLVDAGEASGSLENAFGRMATHFEKSAKTKALVKKAMTYPAVLAVVAVIVMVIMSVYVFPKFAGMFKDMGSDLPGITKMMMAFSDALINKWFIFIAVIAAVVVALKMFASTNTGKHVFGRLSLKAPVFGKMNVKSNSANFARTLSTLVSSGMSLSEALSITGKSMSNVLFQDALEEARLEIEQGVGLAPAIRQSGLFPGMLTQMLEIGEETGNIEGMLDKVAEYYEEEVEIATQGLSAAMEPMIIVVMGGIVAVMVLAMYMPMINMYEGMDSL